MVKDLLDNSALTKQLYPSLRKILQKYGYASDEVFHTKITEAVNQYAGVTSEADFLKSYAKSVMVDLVSKVGCNLNFIF